MLKKQSGIVHLLLIVMVLLVLAAIGVAGFMVIKNKNNTGSDELITARKTACQGNELLSQSPVNVDDISTIIPLGNLAPPGHVLPTYHMYYNYKHGTGNSSYSQRTALYAPADMTVTQMMKMDNADLSIPYESYRIDFSLCSKVGGYFILVQELNDKLAAAMQPPYDRTQESDVGRGTLSHNWYKKVNVELKAGELLGYAGGKKGDPDGLDLAIIDTRKPDPTLANPDRWPITERHYVCSLDYYPAELSKQLYAKLGDYSLKPTGNTNCGSVYQDKPGTAQGVWIAKDAGEGDVLWKVGSLLALVHSNFDANKGAFSIGNNGSQAGLSAGHVSLFSPQQEGKFNLDFGLVKNDGQIYCYEVDNGSGSSDSKTTILVQLTAETSLRIGSKTGKCGSGPWQFDKYLDYVR